MEKPVCRKITTTSIYLGLNDSQAKTKVVGCNFSLTCLYIKYIDSYLELNAPFLF